MPVPAITEIPSRARPGVENVRRRAIVFRTRAFNPCDHRYGHTRSSVLKRIARIICPELITALVLIGVLAAFVQTRTAAHVAEQRSIALTGLAGSVRSGAALAHSIWIADGAEATQISMGDGQTVEIDLVTGYPLANERGIYPLIPRLGGFDVEVNAAGDTFTYSVAGAPSAQCKLTYRTGGARGAPPIVTVINSTNGGDCG